jgi:hypothetical protein
LLAINIDYERLIGFVEKSESQLLLRIRILQRLAGLRTLATSSNTYVTKRLESNAYFISIVTLSGEDISAGQYNYLQRCQATFPSVESNFSMLKNFWLEMVHSVMIILERAC